MTHITYARRYARRVAEEYVASLPDDDLFMRGGGWNTAFGSVCDAVAYSVPTLSEAEVRVIAARALRLERGERLFGE